MDELLRTKAAIAALTEITGQEPDTSESDGAVTIRADPALVAPEHWQRLIAVLETATSYGMTTTAAGTGIIWLRIDPGDPRT
ncbi:hypothetical protein ACODT3_40805 [Streptomyces sp. 4.24]|uniref:hypothetical protein n=1 Tax=Streptomyces tritrimontium TaxID=3406573 RepID=UPI003BB5F274